ncbi:MAG: hypothetical protein PHP92_03265 [Candidatus Nanoarchaeia archaeon]|nr:hypothetical protein [Candidatus Nanoarchaeia archaeon]
MSEIYVQKVCSCGCSEIKVPVHLKSENLFLSTLAHKDQKYVRVIITFEDKVDDKGWEKF